MRAWEIGAGFGLDQLRLVERPDPAPGPFEARVALRAASLNYRDVLIAKGLYDPKQRLPLVPLSDGVGEVTAVGPGVTRVAVGDRVAGAFAQAWVAGAPTPARLRSTLGAPLDGMLREAGIFSAEGLVHVPEHLSDAEAATLPCGAVTAWNALVTHGGVKAGEVVLVQGSGGVSVFALLIAKMLGARVVATSSSEAKRERLRELGAEVVLDYRADPQWGRSIKKLTGGVDHVVEVGGAGTLEQSLRAVRPGATISLIGVLAGGRGEVNLLPVLMNQVRVQGIMVGHRESFEAMNRAFAAAELRPIVDRIFPFEEAPAAFAHLNAGAHFGKVVVSM